MEGDKILKIITHSYIIFQSTPSAWRVTRERVIGDLVLAISIHTLRMEGDTPLCTRCMDALIFQSTPSAWRVTNLNPSSRWTT